MNNQDYFNYSHNNPEELLDEFYKKDVVIIPPTINETNLLIDKNTKMIELISAFDVLINQGLTKNDEPIKRIIGDLILILANTPNINYSPFSQFFMVYNSTYSIFKALPIEEKREFIYQMLLKYCKERHHMYLSHGYSNTILQVMCDNYSHKRNGKSGIEKILGMMAGYSLTRVSSINQLEVVDKGYFLPDKGDKNLFENFLQYFSLEMKSREIEQNKLPDIVFKCNGHFYICELKTMKESGGGQNKQIVEVAYFIKFSENDSRFHYLSFLDCQYSNTLFHDDSPKVKAQRQDIIEALNNNPQNYFLNTKGMQKLIVDLFE